MTGVPGPASAIAYLRSAAAVRERCNEVFDFVAAGQSAHFGLDLQQLQPALDLTLEVTRSAYPDLRQIPVHSRINHFSVGGVPRLRTLEAAITEPRERARALTDLIVTSVLLDAGAGAAWKYLEPETQLVATRSEGLALASYHCLVSGLFSSDPREPLRADAEGLGSVSAERLARAFQVSAQNPLLGLDGRAALLRRLGNTLSARPEQFAHQGRVGGLCDVLVEQAEAGRLPAARVLSQVLEAFAPIWPSRTQRFGVELGDVWEHAGIGGAGPTRGLVPLHKLSQWLSYSLIYPLSVAGVEVVDVDELTGLAEYRNGGLMLDTRLLVPKYPSVTSELHLASSELVVEWRALTVALLDRLASALRQRLGMDARDLPLGKVLEGGTWAAGRRLAAELRQGAPPILVQSDGTLF
jgi:uncharacterized protein DUF1688